MVAHLDRGQRALAGCAGRDSRGALLGIIEDRLAVEVTFQEPDPMERTNHHRIGWYGR
jgi:hypothetical protein